MLSKKPFDVSFYNVAVFSLNFFGEFLYGFLRACSRSVTIAAFLKVLFVDGFQYPSCRSLQYFVFDCRDPYRSGFAIPFWYVGSSDELGFVFLCF